MDENEVVEVTTEEVSDETTEEVTEEKVELTDEQIAEALGVDAEYLAAVKPEIKNLKGFYSKVNKRNQELVERQRELEAKGAKPQERVEDDDDIDLDPQAQKVLRKFIQKEFAPLLSTIEAERTETAAAIMDDFISDHRDVAPDKVYEAMEELGLWQAATTPTKLKKSLTTAYKYAKTNASDFEAEVEARLAERLKSLKSDGEEIVEVRGKRAATRPGVSTAGDIANDPNISWSDLFDALQDD